MSCRRLISILFLLLITGMYANADVASDSPVCINHLKFKKYFGEPLFFSDAMSIWSKLVPVNPETENLREIIDWSLQTIPAIKWRLERPTSTVELEGRLQEALEQAVVAFFNQKIRVKSGWLSLRWRPQSAGLEYFNYLETLRAGQEYLSPQIMGSITARIPRLARSWLNLTFLKPTFAAAEVFDGRGGLVLSHLAAWGLVISKTYFRTLALLWVTMAVLIHDGETQRTQILDTMTYHHEAKTVGNVTGIVDQAPQPDDELTVEIAQKIEKLRSNPQLSQDEKDLLESLQ